MRARCARRRTDSQRHRGVIHGETERIALEFHLRDNVDLVLAAGGDEALTLRTEKRRGPAEGQARQQVEQRQLGAGLGPHRVRYSVGAMNLTAHPWPSTDEIRVGSTILTSDSLAMKVVMRMLSSGVLSTAWRGPNLRVAISGSNEYPCCAACHRSLAKPGE